jgi:hypothetical protein
MIQTTNGHTMSLKHSRDMEIDKARQEKMVNDTKILQKVNLVHREAFKMKFPGQVEHCMRLTAERLQSVITKKPTDLSDPDTWNVSSHEIRDLCEALYYLSVINMTYPVGEQE